MKHSVQYQSVWLVLISSMVLSLLVSCSSSVREIPVSGEVLIDGKPLTTGYVRIVPQNARPATAELDSEGRFQMICYGSEDGGAPGECQVAVIAMEDISPTTQRWHAPESYANPSNSGLSANISKPVANLRFELTSGGTGTRDVIGGLE